MTRLVASSLLLLLLGAACSASASASRRSAFVPPAARDNAKASGSATLGVATDPYYASSSAADDPSRPYYASAVVASSSSDDEWRRRNGDGDDGGGEVVVDDGDRDWRSISESVFAGEDVRPVVLFDGECNLCHGGVNFALDHDTNGNFRFASLQSRVGRSLLRRSGRDPDDISSIVLVGPRRSYFKSDAVMHITSRLDGPYLPLIGNVLCPVLPSSVRDALLQFVADHRHELGELVGFEGADQCRLWDDGFDDRFVADERFAAAAAAAAAAAPS